MTLTNSNLNKAIQVARSYIESHTESMPPMIVGFTAEGEYLALLGAFRDFQEQITFCSIARMSFIVHNINEYYVVTHGDMHYTEDDNVKSREVLVAAGVTPAGRAGRIYSVIRDEGKLTEIRPEMEFNVATSNIEGMFMNLLPTKQTNVPNDIVESVKDVANQIRYMPTITFEEPVVVEPEAPLPTTELSNLEQLFNTWTPN